jgi:hypothetical protein
MPYVVLFHFWMFFSLLWDDTRVPEFQADLISSGQSIPCKLEDIRVGKQIALELHVANKLEEQIEIDRVEPSCGCTVATIDGDKTIDPQKGFTVKMSLRIEDPGIFEKPVFFYRKGTDSPLFAVKIQGNAHEQIQYKLPHSVELDPKTYTATVDLELKALFDDVRMDVSKIAVVGAAFEKFSVVSADPPIDPVDGQPPQGPNNPPQPPPEICGIETDKIECKWPYNFPNTVLGNLKCQLRGKCELNDFNGKQECKDIEDDFPLEEYVGTTTLKKDIIQIVEAPNAPKRKLYEKTEKICYQIYDCETECVDLGMGNFQCKRKENPRVKNTYFEYKWKGKCP